MFNVQFLVAGLALILSVIIDVMISDDFEKKNPKMKYYKHLKDIAKKLYIESKDNTKEDGRVEVIINIDEINLSEKDLDVVKGIILINGHVYYEVSKIQNDKLLKILNHLDSDAQDIDKSIELMMSLS